MYSVDTNSRVRRACLKDGMSAREVARFFNKDLNTITNMLRYEPPSGVSAFRIAAPPDV